MSTYRLGEFRATRVSGRHHIDSTVRECHAKLKEISVHRSRSSFARFKLQTSPISSPKFGPRRSTSSSCVSPTCQRSYQLSLSSVFKYELTCTRLITILHTPLTRRVRARVHKITDSVKLHLKNILIFNKSGSDWRVWSCAVRYLHESQKGDKS